MKTRKNKNRELSFFRIKKEEKIKKRLNLIEIKGIQFVDAEGKLGKTKVKLGNSHSISNDRRMLAAIEKEREVYV